jgi:hypothetical protein
LSVCNALERRGTKCWIASRDVQPGENYQEATVGAIRHARALVLVFSEAANNSDEIKKELSLVSRFHVPLMALRIEDVEPSDAFAYELSTRQWIDAFESWDKSLDALVARLEQISAMPAAIQSATPPRSRRRSAARPFSKVGIAITASLAVLIVAIGAAWFFLRPGAAAAHPMQVRLTGFSSLSPDLPRTLPAALNDELDAAFNDDGVIGVSTAAAPPPGSGPAYALGGTVARDGDKVKVIVRLTDERTGTSLWSNGYTYDSASLGHVARWAGVDVSQAVRAVCSAPRPIPGRYPIQSSRTTSSFASMDRRQKTWISRTRSLPARLTFRGAGRRSPPPPGDPLTSSPRDQSATSCSSKPKRRSAAPSPSIRRTARLSHSRAP